MQEHTLYNIEETIRTISQTRRKAIRIGKVDLNDLEKEVILQYEIRGLRTPGKTTEKIKRKIELAPRISKREQRLSSDRIIKALNDVTSKLKNPVLPKKSTDELNKFTSKLYTAINDILLDKNPAKRMAVRLDKLITSHNSNVQLAYKDWLSKKSTIQAAKKSGYNILARDFKIMLYNDKKFKQMFEKETGLFL